MALWKNGFLLSGLACLLGAAACLLVAAPLAAVTNQVAFENAIRWGTEVSDAVRTYGTAKIPLEQWAYRLGVVGVLLMGGGLLTHATPGALWQTQTSKPIILGAVVVALLAFMLGSGMPSQAGYQFQRYASDVDAAALIVLWGLGVLISPILLALAIGPSLVERQPALLLSWSRSDALLVLAIILYGPGILLSILLLFASLFVDGGWAFLLAGAAMLWSLLNGLTLLGTPALGSDRLRPG